MGTWTEDEGYQMDDVEADADTLASAGMGTDEDYGYFGEENDIYFPEDDDGYFEN